MIYEKVCKNWNSNQNTCNLINKTCLQSYANPEKCPKLRKWQKGKTPWETAKQVQERDIETYLRNEAKKAGIRAYKFVSPGNDGVPDRFLALPTGQAVFVELKAPGKKSTPLQQKKQRELANLGFVVFSDIDTREKVDKVIYYCNQLIAGTGLAEGIYTLSD